MFLNRFTDYSPICDPLCRSPYKAHLAAQLATIQPNFTAPDVYIHLTQSKCVMFSNVLCTSLILFLNAKCIHPLMKLPRKGPI